MKIFNFELFFNITVSQNAFPSIFSLQRLAIKKKVEIVEYNGLENLKHDPLYNMRGGPKHGIAHRPCRSNKNFKYCDIWGTDSIVITFHKEDLALRASKVNKHSLFNPTKVDDWSWIYLTLQ